MSSNYNFKRNITEFISNHSFALTKFIALIFTTTFFLMIQKQPSDPIVFEIQEQVGTFGMLFLIIFGIYVALIKYAQQSDFDNGIKILMFYGGRAMLAITAFAITTWLIGEKGDATKEWVLSNVSGTYILVITSVIVWFIFKLCYTNEPPYQDDLLYSGHGVNLSKNHKLKPNAQLHGPLPELSDRDIEQIAAHEAGHVLVYAAFGCLPPYLEVAINDDGQNSLGYTKGLTSDDNLHKQTLMEWRMVLLLAGQFGQSFIFFENTGGSESDYSKWMFVAKKYLSNGFDGVFYIDPQNKFEQELNEDKLERLQLKQKTQLNDLFSQNEDLFKELCSELVKKKIMNRADLTPYLSQVVIPKDFPLPFGSFTQFSNDWPEDSGLYIDI